MDIQDNQGGDGGAQIDLRRYWLVVQKRRWIIAAAALLMSAAAVAYTARQPKFYSAAATVIVDPMAPKALGREISEVVELGAGNFWGNEDYYNTQYKIIKSLSLSRKVARKFHLDRDKRLLPNPTPGATEEQLIEAAAATLNGKITAAPLKGSRVVAITITDLDKTLVAELANDVADVYIEQNLEVKLDATRVAKRWVAKQLDEARSQVHESETSLYDFRKDNNILSVALEDRQNMITRALEEISGALTTATKERISLQAKRKAVANLLAADALAAPSSGLASADTIEQMRQVYLTTRRDLIALEDHYGPKMPQVIEQQTRVEASLTDLKSEGQTYLRALDGQIAALKDEEARFQAEQGRLTTEALEVNKKEVDYKRLSRDAKNSDSVYSLLLQRYNESALEERDQANNIRMLDPARNPAVLAPNGRKMGILGFAFGIFLGLGLAFFIEFVDRSVKSQEDIESMIGLPFLGMVPSAADLGNNVRGAKDLHIVKFPTSTAAECCRVVRTNILFSSPDKPLKTILVTSSNPVEGKTTTAVNLGIVMAQSGHRTLIVDTDMRRPRLHKVLGTSNENGVSRLIVGETDLESAIKSTDVPGLFLLPCGPIPPNPAELLQTDKFVALARTLAEKFDRVIFDSPPVLAVTDAAVLSRVADGCILVVRAGRTSRDAVIRAKRALGSGGTRIIGVVLNDVDLKNPHYSSYYSSYNYKYHDIKPATGSTPPSA